MYVYQFIREHGNWSNWDMLLIESCKCEDALEARKKERFFIESLHATLNSCIPSRTIKEWEIENKEHIITQHKAYYVNNKEHKNTLTKEYYQNNKAHMTNLRIAKNIENKEQIMKQQQTYYLENKERIQERRRTRIECPCGACFNITNKPGHLKTRKHIAYLQSTTSD